MLVLWFLALLWFPPTPDLSRTPGDLCTLSSPDFQELRYEEQVPYCKRNVGGGLKARVYEDYGVPSADRSSYTIDHLIPLSFGGSNSPKNLWPQHLSISTSRMEQDLFLDLQSGRITQKEAIQRIFSIKMRTKNHGSR